MPYPTDLSDAQWYLLEPVLGRGGSRGPVPSVDRRKMVDAVLYQAKTGCQWRMLPAEFGNWNTVWRTWARWRDRGVWQRVWTWCVAGSGWPRAGMRSLRCWWWTAMW